MIRAISASGAPLPDDAFRGTFTRAASIPDGPALAYALAVLGTDRKLTPFVLAGFDSAMHDLTPGADLPEADRRAVRDWMRVAAMHGAVLEVTAG